MSSHSSTSTSIIAWITASAFFLNVIFSNEGAEHSLWQITLRHLYYCTGWLLPASRQSVNQCIGEYGEDK